MVTWSPPSPRSAHKVRRPHLRRAELELRRLRVRERLLRSPRARPLRLEVGDVVEAVVCFEDVDLAKVRPLVVIDLTDDRGSVDAMPVTSRTRRFGDPRYVVLGDWEEAGLRLPSAAERTKRCRLDASQILRRVGRLTDADRCAVTGPARGDR